MHYPTGQSPDRPTKPSEPRMGYQWPADKLTSDDMMKLTALRTETKKPINALLHEAVSALYDLLQKQM